MFFATIITGCGQDSSSVKRYQLSGTVSFQGSPVPYGEVYFSPDQSAGNDGPSSVTSIQDGKYRLPQEQGIVGGKYKIQVQAYESEPSHDADGELVLGKKLFPEQELLAELPTGGTYDLVIPAQKKK